MVRIAGSGCYDQCGMKKPQIAKRLAKRSGVSRAEAADQLDRMVNELGLRPVGAGQWHIFPPPGGITGMLLLAESHLTLHTFPEHRSLCLNLFCCTPRETWPFAERLAEAVGAARVSVRHLEREYAVDVVASRP